jgi:mannosyl-oligosaccharide alpha-1,2-mannosidase
MFATGALAIKPANFKELFRLGARITDTCYSMYEQSENGLGGETAYIEKGKVVLRDSSYIQRPEVIESIFYMWRFTHDPKYRDYGLKIIENMNKHIRNDVAFYDLNSDGKPGDKMESFFLAETLKYLYLLFVDDNVISLEHYVFNTEAHPLSVRGSGRRANPSKWTKIKETHEYSPKVGEIKEPLD